MAKKKGSKKVIGKVVLPGSQSEITDMSDLGKLEDMSSRVAEELSEDQKTDIIAMLDLAARGITPEEYTRFYDIFKMSEAVVGKLYADDDSDWSSSYSDDMYNDDDSMFTFPGGGFGMRKCNVKEYKPLVDAADKTLVLKIQMKGVTKPPMWREVEVPADYDFLELHRVIQTVVGLENCHLWEFGVKAHDHSLVIGFGYDGKDPDSPWVEGVTNEAGVTPLTQFLQKKGDKLEYLYDFGDDWIFTVEVKDVPDKKIEKPICRKYKCELNAIEDFGGVWSYLDAREDLDNWDKLTKKQRKERASDQGFDSADEYLEFLEDCRMDLDEVNKRLQSF